MWRRRSRFSQPAFDREADYVANKAFKWFSREAGETISFEAGAPFPIPDDAPVRELQQIQSLYDWGTLIRADDPKSPSGQPSGLMVVKRSVGWFDVVDQAGKRMNERALRRDAADELAAAGLPKDLEEAA